MNENQKRQMEDAVKLAHETCCDAAGMREKSYGGHSHMAHMATGSKARMGHEYKEGDRNEPENAKMYG